MGKRAQPERAQAEQARALAAGRKAARRGWLALPVLAALLVSTPVLAQQPAPRGPGAEPLRGSSASPLEVPDYRNALRQTITALGEFARSKNPYFAIVSRSGLGLIVKGEYEVKLEELKRLRTPDGLSVPVEPAGTVVRQYAKLIDGVILDGQFCVEIPTASAAFVQMLRQTALTVLSADHCGSVETLPDAYRAARRQGIIPHLDAGRGPLQDLAAAVPLNESSDNVMTLADGRNFLLLDGNRGAPSKKHWLESLHATNFDIIAIDPFYRDTEPLTPAEVRALKFKKLGARRIVLARMNVTHAFDTKYYWKSDWRAGSPRWLELPILSQPGAFEVQYWNPEWQAILGKTFAGIMDLGFDGVVLEGLDVYKAREAAAPIK